MVQYLAKTLLLLLYLTLLLVTSMADMSLFISWFHQGSRTKFWAVSKVSLQDTDSTLRNNVCRNIPRFFLRLRLLHYLQAISDHLAKAQERAALYFHIGLNLGISKLFAKALRLNDFAENETNWSTVGAGVPAAAEVFSCMRVWSAASLRTACRCSEHVEQASQIPPRCMN